MSNSIITPMCFNGMFVATLFATTLCCCDFDFHMEHSSITTAKPQQPKMSLKLSLLSVYST